MTFTNLSAGGVGVSADAWGQERANCKEAYWVGLPAIPLVERALRLVSVASHQIVEDIHRAYA